MSYTLAQFTAECRRILAADLGFAGREEVRALLSVVCSDAAFVATYLGDDVSEREIFYEDPDLGFCILGHIDHAARLSRPHDHGPTWAIYGQAAGRTIMTEWEIISPPPSDDMPGKARRAREYLMTPGSAYIYNEGVVHSPWRCGPTRLLRVEGSNIAYIRSAHFEEV